MGLHLCLLPRASNNLLSLYSTTRYGQPPAEIIKEIAPGLELDEDGLPKNLDGNGGMPFSGGDEDCRIM